MAWFFRCLVLIGETKILMADTYIQFKWKGRIERKKLDKPIKNSQVDRTVYLIKTDPLIYKFIFKKKKWGNKTPKYTPLACQLLTSINPWIVVCSPRSMKNKSMKPAEGTKLSWMVFNGRVSWTFSSLVEHANKSREKHETKSKAIYYRDCVVSCTTETKFSDTWDKKQGYLLSRLCGFLHHRNKVFW